MSTSLSDIYFRFKRFIFFGTGKQSGFLVFCYHHKLLKFKEINESWTSFYDKG